MHKYIISILWCNSLIMSKHNVNHIVSKSQSSHVCVRGSCSYTSICIDAYLVYLVCTVLAYNNWIMRTRTRFLNRNYYCCCYMLFFGSHTFFDATAVTGEYYFPIASRYYLLLLLFTRSFPQSARTRILPISPSPSIIDNPQNHVWNCSARRP